MIINLQTFQEAFPNPNNLLDHRLVVQDKSTKAFLVVDLPLVNQKICKSSHQIFSLYKHSKNAAIPDAQKKIIREMALQVFDEKYHVKPDSRDIFSRFLSAIENGSSGFGFRSSDAMLMKMIKMSF